MIWGILYSFILITKIKLKQLYVSVDYLAQILQKIQFFWGLYV